MGISPEARPFGAAPDPDAFFPGAGREDACQALILNILGGKRFLHLGGATGSGKTQLCRALMARLPGDVTPVYQDAPTGSFDEVIRHACVDLGAARSSGDGNFSWAGEFDRLLARRLEEGNRVLLILDQAERLFSATLERLLTRVGKGDLPPFTVLLAGSPELDGPLAQLAALGPEFRPDGSWTLAPLDRDETEQYLRYRLHAAGVGWNEQDAMLDRKRIDRIFRQARGNIGATDAAAAEILGLETAPPEQTSERQLPLWDTAGEHRRTVLSPRVSAAAAATEPEPPVEAATVVPEPVEAAESAIVAEAVEAPEAPETAFAFENIAPQASVFAEPEEPETPEELQDDEADEDDEDVDDERGGLWEGLAALEERIAPPVIALYDKLWGDKKTLGGVLGLGLVFCIVGLSLGTTDVPETPAPAPPPVETPAATSRQPSAPAQAAVPDGAALLRERLAAGRSLVAASYRGAHTIQVLALSGDTAERELAELLATPPFRQEAANLYVVRKPGAPPALFLFYGLYDDAEQARQARNSMGFELRAHHPYPLPVGDALRLNGN